MCDFILETDKYRACSTKVKWESLRYNQLIQLDTNLFTLITHYNFNRVTISRSINTPIAKFVSAYKAVKWVWFFFIFWLTGSVFVLRLVKAPKSIKAAPRLTKNSRNQQKPNRNRKSHGTQKG